MTLREIIGNLDDLSNDLVIFAEKNSDWLLDSPAALVLASEMERAGTQLEVLLYFLEIEIAKEVLGVWSKWRDGRKPTEAERIEALFYYADNDAYLG